MLAAAHDLLPLAPGDTVAALVSATSSTAPLDLLAPLAAGACIALAPEDADEDGELLADFVRTAAPSVLVAPADVWESLRAATWDGSSTLRAVVLGTSSDALRTWLASVSARVVSVHGAAQFGGWAAAHEQLTTRDALLLGRPLFPGAAWIRGDDGTPAPTGVPGTLVLGQASRRDEEERGRQRPDGTIQLLASDTNSLQWAEGTIRLAAIERRLRAHPAIADACVTAFPDASGRSRLVAFVVRRSGQDDTTDSQLRRTLRELLPQSHVPRLFVDIDEIPRLPSGGAARHRLPSPFASGRDAAHRIAPRSEQERYLAALWREYLPVSDIGVHDNFFTLGGYSLLCFQLVRRVAQETGRHISPRNLLFGTLEQVAQQLATPS
jgi:acyl-coenzyme A synthetase/AMP-(fatty) acid ligase